MNSPRSQISSQADKKTLSLVQWFANHWMNAAYGSAKWIYLFYPLSLIFFGISKTRKWYLIHFCQPPLSIPLVVVGNISLGGTGKTPLLIALVNYFQSQGKKVGVVSRGYGGSAEQYPCVIDKDSKAEQVGDEPLMIFNRTSACVCVGANRVVSAQKLITLGCELILSDDGLQHYRLARDIEILVVDAERKFGNQKLIPMGPLRESVNRVSEMDFVCINETQSASADFKFQLTQQLSQDGVFSFTLVPQSFVEVKSGKSVSITDFIASHAATNRHCQFIAGIGNPEAFFSSLNQLGLKGTAHAFPDHYSFVADDFLGMDEGTIVMTEKDAVKVKSFAKPNWYYLESSVVLDSKLLNQLAGKLKLDSGN